MELCGFLTIYSASIMSLILILRCKVYRMDSDDRLGRNNLGV